LLLSLQASIFVASLFFRILASCVILLMNEYQRQAYLKVLDIQPFYLKKALPAAKASPSYDYPQSSYESVKLARPVAVQRETGSVARRPSGQESSAVSSGGVRDDNQPVGLSDLKAQLRQAAGKSAVKLRENEMPAAQAVEPTAYVEGAIATEFNFKIRYFYINEQLAVIDELPYAQGDEGSGVKIELLKAILSALEVNWSDSDFRTESFSWPIDSLMEIEVDSKLAAQQILKGFIAQRYAAHKFKNLLVFAGQIEAILAEPMSEVTGAAENPQDFIQMPQNYHMTLTSTLSAMLSYPLLKRQVWAHLQPLKIRLAAAV